MQRLYVENALEAAGSVRLESDKAHYILHVLRMKAGESLLFFNGVNGEWQGKLVALDKKSATFTLVLQTRVQEPAPNLRYAFAPLKAARLDYMIQKAVEMGAGRLTPVYTQHTQVQKLKLERMQANAIEAAEQCEILSLPQLDDGMSFEKFLASLTGQTLIFCDEEAPIANPIQALTGLKGEVCVLIGPEGGFSREEREKLLLVPNSIRLSLGKTILRADTAAVAALALVGASLIKK